MTNQYHSHLAFFSHRMLFRTVHQHKSTLPPPYRKTFLITLLKHLHLRIPWLFAARRRLFLKSGQRLAALRRSQVRVCQILDIQCLDKSTCLGHASPILCASFSPTGDHLATGAGDCTVRLWNLSTETPSHTLNGHKGWVLCVEWEGMGRRLASGGHDNHVRGRTIKHAVNITDSSTGAPMGSKNG